MWKWHRLVIDQFAVRHMPAGVDWIRLRNNGGTYTLQFSESLKEDEFIIAPTMDFQVSIFSPGTKLFPLTAVSYVGQR